MHTATTCILTGKESKRKNFHLIFWQNILAGEGNHSSTNDFRQVDPATQNFAILLIQNEHDIQINIIVSCRLVKWKNPSFTSLKYFYRCTHKHSLFAYLFVQYKIRCNKKSWIRPWREITIIGIFLHGARTTCSWNLNASL
jgi:hypothetical protein